MKPWQRLVHMYPQAQRKQVFRLTKTSMFASLEAIVQEQHEQDRDLATETLPHEEGHTQEETIISVYRIDIRRKYEYAKTPPEKITEAFKRFFIAF